MYTNDRNFGTDCFCYAVCHLADLCNWRLQQKQYILYSAQTIQTYDCEATNTDSLRWRQQSDIQSSKY